MSVIDKYFLKKTDKISFIELNNSKKEYEKIGIADIPLPVILDEMLDGISSKNFENEINMEYIADGMIYTIAVDSSFLYINDYKKILNNLTKNPSSYSLLRAIKFMDENMEKAIIFARAAFILDEKNEFAAYTYAKLLWNIEIPEEEKHVFVEESVRILERILHYNEKNVLANFELGNINTALGEYIKANNFYQRALSFSNDEILSEEIRNITNKIAPDIAVENAIYYINKMNYSRAIEELMEVRKNSSRYDIPYYIAISYMNLENPKMAEIFFEEAIEKGADFSTLYTDLVYIKYVLKKDFEALQIANEALEKFPTDIKLRYNRALIYVDQKKYDKANEDFDFILEYQDLSDEWFNQIMKIKESIGE